MCFELEPIFKIIDGKEWVEELKCVDCGRLFSTRRQTKEEYFTEFFKSGKK